MAKELILSGRVQGVFCRRYCRENAKKLGLQGTASNLYNGDVRVIIDSNDEEKIARYIEVLKTNPFGFAFYGRIDEIQIKDYSGAIRGDYSF